MLALGGGSHLLALLRRPLVWELPIAAAYAFAMLSLAAVYAALHGRRPVLAMAGAGLSLGLAVASRPTWIFGAVMLVPALWTLRELPQTRERWRRAAVSAAMGFGMCVVAVLAAGAYVVTMGGVITAYFLATPRYAADFGPALTLVALVGLLAVERWSIGRRTKD